MRNQAETTGLIVLSRTRRRELKLAETIYYIAAARPRFNCTGIQSVISNERFPPIHQSVGLLPHQLIGFRKSVRYSKLKIALLLICFLLSPIVRSRTTANSALLLDSPHPRRCNYMSLPTRTMGVFVSTTTCRHDDSTYTGVAFDGKLYSCDYC